MDHPEESQSREAAPAEQPLSLDSPFELRLLSFLRQKIAALGIFLDTHLSKSQKEFDKSDERVRLKRHNAWLMERDILELLSDFQRTAREMDFPIPIKIQSLQAAIEREAYSNPRVITKIEDLLSLLDVLYFIAYYGANRTLRIMCNILLGGILINPLQNPVHTRDIALSEVLKDPPPKE